MATEKERCMYTYKAALFCLQNHDNHPEMFIRELSLTEPCDKYYDFSQLRQSIEQDIGKDTIDRINKYERNYTDTLKARQVFYRYNDESKNSLNKAIGEKNKYLGALAAGGVGLLALGMLI